MSFPEQDPFLWFDKEFKIATQTPVPEVNAIQLATLSAEGFPTVRTVYFKGWVRGGFSFYTNYHSQKSHELVSLNKAGLNFFWPQLFQQIRVEGIVERLTRAESEAYFRTRARLSQIGAWASEQSQTIPDSRWLLDRVQMFEKKFEGQDVPCPPDWGGYHLLPLQFEFWFGKTGRLHERYCFQRKNVSSAHWIQSMKSP